MITDTQLVLVLAVWTRIKLGGTLNENIRRMADGMREARKELSPDDN